MNKIVKVGISCIASFSFLLITSFPVLAATVYAGGGTWNYGVGTKYVWSYYSHSSKVHKSSVLGRNYISSGWTRKGVQARASTEKAITGNKSYYDVK